MSMVKLAVCSVFMLASALTAGAMSVYIRSKRLLHIHTWHVPPTANVGPNSEILPHSHEISGILQHINSQPFLLCYAGCHEGSAVSWIDAEGSNG